MKPEEKELYRKVKNKHYRNFNRVIKKVFSEHIEKLKHRSPKEAQIIGDWISVFEMEMKAELKKQA